MRPALFALMLVLAMAGAAGAALSLSATKGTVRRG